MRRSSLPRLGPCVAAFLLAAACTLTAPWGTPPARADASKDARKAFREALKSEHWKDRQEAYLRMADADGAEAVRAILDELSKEENPAVVLTGIGVLAGFESEPARALLVRELHKGRDATRMVVLLALERHEGDAAVPHLLEIVQGTDAPAAAQAALALGRKQVLTAVPHLVDLLRAKDWQCQRAAAVALRRLAQPPPPPPEPGKAPGEQDVLPPPPVPDDLKAAAVTQALVKALAAARGRERGDIGAALAAIHGQDHGTNVAAWRMVATGKEPDERALAQREHPPYAFGIPIHGRRVVLIYDNSLRSGDPHRFGSGRRMRALCEVPGDFPLRQARLRKVGQFAQAHLERCIRGMPKGVQFELITFNERVRPLFGRFMGAGGGARKAVQGLFTELEPDDGIATFGVLMAALDTGGAGRGAGRGAAWKRGPDEIVFVTCNMPTVGDVTDAAAVGGAIGLEARVRMVPIHTIGITEHPYAMLETIAGQSGGVYRNYYE